jgi:hypothetical protein
MISRTRRIMIRKIKTIMRCSNLKIRRRKVRMKTKRMMSKRSMGMMYHSIVTLTSLKISKKSPKRRAKKMRR